MAMMMIGEKKMELMKVATAPKAVTMNAKNPPLHGNTAALYWYFEPVPGKIESNQAE
eukprot:CAMPEP_0205909456 /NCGR_PEP_ID=MMETSP1325-20131115/3886_1 /ASSEMBLY_ACC=CAM_ASM_000708 /TAXON_ID=236786 /ORGANISM="Florenciella sp., Strain RCC1007" /LENGTH=56 /DNA_ID=CAMNT_0053275747 /DNA_START=51 /DNA_END=221 /DNA_ORIENTATION=-